MAETHEHGAGFLDLATQTQRAYTERRTDDYVAAFSAGYYSVQLHTAWGEDKAKLAAKIASDARRFELLKMDFKILRSWFIEETGYAHMQYTTHLRFRDSGRVLIDKRENLVTGAHRGDGLWELTGKIVISAQNYFAEEQPDI